MLFTVYIKRPKSFVQDYQSLKASGKNFLKIIIGYAVEKLFEKKLLAKRKFEKLLGSKMLFIRQQNSYKSKREQFMDKQYLVMIDLISFFYRI